jgi:hypothetical protein
VTGIRLSGLLWPGEDARRSIDKVRGWRKPSEKDLAVVKFGVARSEIRALSGAEIDDLVALETEPGDSEKS